MSKKQVFKKGFAALTVLTMAFGAAVNVSANATYSTTTEYDLSSERVTVKSTILGVGNEEQVTYLAYDRTRASGQPVGGTDSNIIYIDQKASDAQGKCIFEYTANANDVGRTLVKFGAAQTSSITPQGEEIFIVNVNYDSTKGSVVYSLEDETCTFEIQPGTGMKIQSITRQTGPSSEAVAVSLEGLITGGICYYTAENVTADFILNVEFSELSVSTGIADGQKFGDAILVVDGEGDTTANSITTFSKITVDTSLSYEYGILFSYTANARFTGSNGIWSENLSENNGVKKYQAFGKADGGEYAVRLIDGGSNYLKGNADTVYYTTPYIVINGDYINGAYYGESQAFGSNQ